MKHVIFAISLLVLVSCKDNKKQESNTQKENVEQNVEATNVLHDAHTSQVYDNSWINEMEMNNGAKWQADVKTNEGVQKMQNSIKNQTTSTLDDYYKLAKQLNDDKNYVVKNCTMKGASHDNLHVWLLPLMSKIEALSEAKTIDDASKLKQSIEENINGYNTYFQ